LGYLFVKHWSPNIFFDQMSRLAKQSWTKSSGAAVVAPCEGELCRIYQVSAVEPVKGVFWKFCTSYSLHDNLIVTYKLDLRKLWKSAWQLNFTLCGHLYIYIIMKFEVKLLTSFGFFYLCNCTHCCKWGNIICISFLILYAMIKYK